MDTVEPQARKTVFSRFLRFLRRRPMVVALCLLALWSYAFYALGQYVIYRTHPELTQSDRANQVVARVSELIALPQGEAPQMAVINNAAEAKQAQPFLANAADGDVLIVYQQAGEALLYRPSSNKLIAVGPVTNQPPAGTQSIAPVSNQDSANATTSSKSKK